ncbi:zinc finger protein 723-like [Bradysia coprophila]|uniref:zinc finger protein 723-like n=1 Tax=Bradysia coprophila TaxID=38358 RepID=UPI00187DD051|nr:zinc finger protein 723-like [Bradysia coprophila]
MEFAIKDNYEEFEIKQEQEDFETTFQIIEFEQIFKSEPLQEEYHDERSIKDEPIEDTFLDTSGTRPDIKLEQREAEFQENLTVDPEDTKTKFVLIHRDHTYARAYQPFIDRNGKHNPKIAEIKKFLKRKSHPTGPKEPQICDICGQSFVVCSAFDRHILRHGSAPHLLFECDICGTKRKLMNHLMKHMLVHTKVHTIPKIKIPCKICGLLYEQRYLTTHMSIHNTQPSLECTICGKYFATRGRLTSHMRCHNDKKKAPCRVCGKPFTIPGPLRIHERIHTGEKPYLCWICGLRFRALTTCNTHLTVHWTGKNFPCKQCDAKFKNPNCLDTHRRKVHCPKTMKVKPVVTQTHRTIKVPAASNIQPAISRPNVCVSNRTYSKKLQGLNHS